MSRYKSHRDTFTLRSLFWSPQFKKDGTDWSRSRGGEQRWSKGWRSCPVSKDKNSWVLSPCESLPSAAVPAHPPKEDGGSLSTRRHREKTRGSGYKLHQESFHPNVRKKCLTVRTTIHWIRTGHHLISHRIPFWQKAGPEDISRSLPTWDIPRFISSFPLHGKHTEL